MVNLFGLAIRRHFLQRSLVGWFGSSLVDACRNTTIDGFVVVELFLLAALLRFLVGQVLLVLLHLTVPIVNERNSTNLLVKVKQFYMII